MSWTQTYTGDAPCRINKWLGQQGVCSRREAEGLIEAGLISIDGVTVDSPGRKILPGETLTLAGQGANALAEQLSVIIHKPAGYVSAHPEPGQRPADQLLIAERQFGKGKTIPPRDAKLPPLGRLDQDSRGLLILSQDGVLAKTIIGPDSDWEKEYLVEVRGEITDKKLKMLQFGMQLDRRQLKRAIVEEVEPGRLRFVLREGRNRQIRRMCENVSLFVTDLVRIRIGPVRLEDLPEGQWRLMRDEERAAFVAGPYSRS